MTAAPSTPPRLLLAEDNRLAATITHRVLTDAGYAVDIVRDGVEAFEALSRRTYDLLITDWVMPRLDGVELCRALRARSEDASLYVVFLSARDQTPQLVEALGAGADDYLAKPFQAEELLARVRAGLRIVGLQRDLEAANRTLSRLALTDALTDLPNRRAVDDLLAIEVARLARWAEPCCVAIVDIDHFKRINDTHGHAQGDRVLVAVAGALRTAARAADIVGRLGGEEFLVTLHGATLAASEIACERLRSAVASLRIPAPNGGELAVTVSIGVAALVPGAKAGDVLAAADAALYTAKHAGRNRVAAADGDAVAHLARAA